MLRKRETQATSAKGRPTCNPARVYFDAPGQDLPMAGFVGRERCSENTEDILFALAMAVEQRDPRTGSHCERLAFISVTLGIAMGLDRFTLRTLYRGGFLHDVGKVGIPDSILFKPDKLTADEWVVMRSHTTRGEEICRNLKTLRPVLPIIRHHHERWDGSGYPDGLRGEQIPLEARVLQIADIYDALTNPRPYKPAFSVPKALEIMGEETDRGWRDPEIFKLFMRIHKSLVPGTGGPARRKDHSTEIMRSSLLNLRDSLGREDCGLMPVTPAAVAAPVFNGD